MPAGDVDRRAGARPRARRARRPQPRAARGRHRSCRSGARRANAAWSSQDRTGGWPPARCAQLAQRLGWPMLAEPTSRAPASGWALAAGQSLSRRGVHATPPPEVVLQIGASPTTRASKRSGRAARAARRRRRSPPRPRSREVASWRLRGRPGGARRRGPRTVRRASARTRGSRKAGRHADADARRDRRVSTPGRADGAAFARDLAASIPAGDARRRFVDADPRSRLFDGAPGRSAGPRQSRRQRDRRVRVDGVGDRRAGEPTYALCGDLTLLHDAGSLLWSARRRAEPVLVVPNNDGGGVFSFLPQHDLPECDVCSRHRRAGPGCVVRGRGRGHTAMSSCGARCAVERAAAAGGVHVVDVPSDRERNVERHRSPGGGRCGARVSDALPLDEGAAMELEIKRFERRRGAHVRQGNVRGRADRRDDDRPSEVRARLEVVGARRVRSPEPRRARWSTWGSSCPVARRAR